MHVQEARRREDPLRSGHHPFHYDENAEIELLKDYVRPARFRGLSGYLVALEKAITLDWYSYGLTIQQQILYELQLLFHVLQRAMSVQTASPREACDLLLHTLKGIVTENAFYVANPNVRNSFLASRFFPTDSPLHVPNAGNTTHNLFSAASTHLPPP